MTSTISHGASTAPHSGTGPRPELLQWLQNGRLTLVGADHEPVSEEEWLELPAAVREKALADFDRVVRGNAKAAVIFLGRY